MKPSERRRAINKINATIRDTWCKPGQCPKYSTKYSTMCGASGPFTQTPGVARRTGHCPTFEYLKRAMGVR